MSRRNPVRINYRDLERMVPITKVIIEVVPHLTQRYETCGDWFRTVETNTNATLHIRASKLGKDIDPYNLMALCVGYHELTEALACIANNIGEKTVDEWDMNYTGDDPGADEKCPYGPQHRFASIVEQKLLIAMGFFWSHYEKAIARLWKKPID